MIRGFTELLEKYGVSGGLEYVPLGKVAEVWTGKSDKKDAQENGQYPFYVRSKNILSMNTYEFDEEAIIMPWEWWIWNIFHYVHGKYALHQRAYRIHFYDERIDTKFMYYWVKQNFKNYVQRRIRHGTVASIRKWDLLDFPIPLPPLPVQKAIVDYLDPLFADYEILLEKLTLNIQMRKQEQKMILKGMLDFEPQSGKELFPILANIVEEYSKNSATQSWKTPISGGGRRIHSLRKVRSLSLNMCHLGRFVSWNVDVLSQKKISPNILENILSIHPKLSTMEWLGK